MKTISISLLLILTFSLTAFSQDILVKHDGSELKTKVKEISETTISYLLFDMQDGPIRTIDKTDVFMILYENGTRETITIKNELAMPSEKVETSRGGNEYDGKYFMLGVGYGNSYGGSGVRAQFRTGGIVGFGAHIGAGYFPEAPVLASAGLKFFYYKGLYLNTQFGLVGWKDDYYDYYSSSNKELTYGPSALLGADFAWGKKVGFGFNVGAGTTYVINGYGTEFDVALDLGFVVRL
ncbi:hypothetical protein [Mangrovimonas sp. DI 80]|uniref:hypothetical protein n=1 Tax=Mangrovimonas sp. DI 80 TaxID=1779330 RepID=UPI0009779E68|nr:hypothetical protein [Mangrovimonas sp. DI 80]OMP29952.1 hypothetical protein BKM32_15220 [Mangrovimonas sp. DI 80]